MTSFGPVSATPVSTLEAPALAASGALAAADATLSATADAILAANGALGAEDATTFGAAGDVDIVGTLAAPAATISGNVDVVAAMSGVLFAQPVNVSGQTRRKLSLSGSLAPSDSSVAASTRRRLGGSGVLTTALATLTGRTVFIRLFEKTENDIDEHTFTIKQKDTSPQPKVQLKDPDGGDTDLSLVIAVTFSMRDRQGVTVIDDAQANIVDAQRGLIKYAWQAGDTDVPGTFYAEWRVTFTSGAVETWPNNGYMPVLIIPQAH